MRFWRAAPFVLMVLLAAVPADASDRQIVAGPTDFWFEFDEPSILTARAYAWSFGIDSMLWVYDSAGNIVAANDDYFGLDSFLSVPVDVGLYRVRAGVCCGDPERWYGESYQIEFNAEPQEPVTTTTTVEETTTTVEETTTTVEETTTTVEETTTTVEETTTTTTEPETTTTEPTPTDPPQTTEPPATTTPPATTPPTTNRPPRTTSTTPTEETTWPPTTPPVTTEPATTPPSTEPAVTQPTVPVDTNAVTTQPATVPSVSPTAPPATNNPPPNPPSPTSSSSLAPESPSDTTTTTTSQIPPAPNNDASDAEKETFESQVNVFSGAYDNYVPAGSTVTVAQRRTIVAATIAISTVLPGPAPKRRKK